MLLVCARLGVNTLIIVVWSSNSGCYLLRGLHAVPSEVRLAFIKVLVLFWFVDINLDDLYNIKFYSWLIFLFLCLLFGIFVVWQRLILLLLSLLRASLSWCWALILSVVVGGLHYAFGWICHCSCYEIVVLCSVIFWEVILFFFKNEVVFCVFFVWVHRS